MATFPLWSILYVSIPAVHRWNRFVSPVLAFSLLTTRVQSALIPLWSPTIVLIGSGNISLRIPAKDAIGFDIPVFAILLIAGVVLAIVVAATTNWESPPIYYFVRIAFFLARHALANC